MSSRTILVIAEPFGEALSAVQVAEEIGRGLRAGDPSLEVDPPSLEVDPCYLDRPKTSPTEASELRASLDAVGFDARMFRARAVVIAAKRLDRHTLLQRGAVFEIATRARQSGVPCYAVAEHNRLDLFAARILDLQVALEAGDVRHLRAAGRKLAGIV